MTEQLLAQNPDPDEEAIRHYLSGNLCRCAAYPEIIDAVRLAVAGSSPTRMSVIWRVTVMIHRYLGIAVGALMLMWFGSGMVMMYVPYPQLSACAASSIAARHSASTPAAPRGKFQLADDEPVQSAPDRDAARPARRADQAGWTPAPLRRTRRRRGGPGGRGKSAADRTGSRTAHHRTIGRYCRICPD